MEHVLDLYQHPYCPDEPVVCMDETTKQLTMDVIAPEPAKPGHLAHYDTLYTRNGVGVLFMFFEPLSGWRRVSVSESKRRIDWADQIKTLLDIDYPDAKKVHLVMDNLNTHGGASLYERFPPPEAHRLFSRLEFHYTPKHGSWLNMAEIELSVLSRQCLNQRIKDIETLGNEVGSWQSDRNNKKAIADWQFTTVDARTKLKKLYPTT
jgi:DDE superfamily endonuclease